MITYRHDGLSPFKITVKLDSRTVGSIRRHDGTGFYFYNPKGQTLKNTGELFKTVDAVKASIEGRA